MRSLLVVVLALAGAVAVSSANGAQSSTIVIRVKSVQTFGHVVHNVPPASLSKGDVIVERDKLYNVARQFGKPVGALIGTDQATITLLAGNLATLTGSAVFPDGTVRFKATVHVLAAGPAPIPIVGGTGRYAHARGSVTESNATGGTTTALNTYKIITP
jgi:hypothetical protein